MGWQQELIRDATSSGLQYAWDNRKDLNRSYMRRYNYLQRLKKNGPIYSRRRLRGLKTRRARKYRRRPVHFRKSNVGDSLRAVDYKREAIHADWAGIASRSLFSALLTDIPLTTTNDDIGRASSAVIIKGFKIHWFIQNKYQGCPLFCNIAILAPNAANTIGATNFFKSDGLNPTERYMDFTLSRTSRQLHLANINSQDHTILWHKRFILTTTGNGDVVGTNANRGGGPADWRHVKKWVKMNRKITYDNPTGTSCMSPVMLVYWIDRMDANAGASPITNCAECAFYMTTFFRDA